MKSYCLEPGLWLKALFIPIWVVVVGGRGIPRNSKATVLSGERELYLIVSQVAREPLWSISAAE